MSWLVGLAALSLNSPSLAVPWLAPDLAGVSSEGPRSALADGSFADEPLATPVAPAPAEAKPVDERLPTSPVEPATTQPPSAGPADPAESASSDPKSAEPGAPTGSGSTEANPPEIQPTEVTPPEADPLEPAPPSDAAAAATPESPSLPVGDGSLTSANAPEEAGSSTSGSSQGAVEPNLAGLNGRIRVGLGLLLSAQGGNLSSSLAYGAAGGLGPSIDVGFGLNRNTALGLYGSMAWLGSGSTCASCSAFVAGGGAFVRHHLVQGLRLDPWVSYGLGVKAWELSQSGANDSATALEWLRASVGADWFAGRGWFFGPYLQLSLSTTFASSRGNVGETQYEGGLGIRLGFDTPTR